MTTLALVDAPTPTERTLVQLESLRTQLDVADLPLADAIDARDRAEVLRSYAKTARLGLEVANEASELRLRAERRCGSILIDLTLQAPPLQAQSVRRRGASKQSSPLRMTLPPRTLRELGISPKDSSKWQLLAKLPQPEFDARMTALKGAGVQVSAQPFLRAAQQFARPVSGRPTTPTLSLLRRALLLLKDVRVLRTPREVDLARAVARIADAWDTELEPKASPTEWARDQTCLMCGRTRPSSKPSRCQACGGAWVATV